MYCPMKHCKIQSEKYTLVAQWLVCMYGSVMYNSHHGFVSWQPAVETITIIIIIFRAGNLLIRSSLICSFRSNQMSGCERFSQDKWGTVSKLLRSLRGNEQPWANRSGRSRQMSDHEQFDQAAQRKWANFGLKNLKSCFSMFHIRFLKKLLKKWANRSFSLISSFLVSDGSESLISL